MQIDRNANGIVISPVSPESFQSIQLRSEETGRLIAGEPLLRAGVILRRLGDIVELRTARPGVALDRRVLATAAVDDFLVA